MRVRGVHPKYPKEQQYEIARHYLESEMSLVEVAAIYNISDQTVLNYVKNYNKFPKEQKEVK